MCYVWGTLVLIFAGMGDGLLVLLGCRGQGVGGSVSRSWSPVDCLIDGSIADWRFERERSFVQGHFGFETVYRDWFWRVRARHNILHFLWSRYLLRRE